jgi:hypothetical protein
VNVTQHIMPAILLREHNPSTFLAPIPFFESHFGIPILSFERVIRAELFQSKVRAHRQAKPAEACIQKSSAMDRNQAIL